MCGAVGVCRCGWICVGVGECGLRDTYLEIDSLNFISAKHQIVN